MTAKRAVRLRERLVHHTAWTPSRRSVHPKRELWLSARSDACFDPVQGEETSGTSSPIFIQLRFRNSIVTHSFAVLPYKFSLYFSRVALVADR